MNKFDKFYSKKGTEELIQQILSHKTFENTIDKEWYEALLVHLQSRELTDNQKNKLDYILKTDSETLKIENMSEEQKAEIIKEKINIEDNLRVIPSGIVEAGKSLKNVVYVILVSLIISLIIVIMLFNTYNMSDAKTYYIILSATMFIGNIIILFQLYSAGDNLEKSVQQK